MKAVTAACGCTDIVSYVCAALNSDWMSLLIGAAAPEIPSWARVSDGAVIVGHRLRSCCHCAWGVRSDVDCWLTGVLEHVAARTLSRDIILLEERGHVEDLGVGGMILQGILNRIMGWGGLGLYWSVLGQRQVKTRGISGLPEKPSVYQERLCAVELDGSSLSWKMWPWACLNACFCIITQHDERVGTDSARVETPELLVWCWWSCDMESMYR